MRAIPLPLALLVLLAAAPAAAGTAAAPGQACIARRDIRTITLAEPMLMRFQMQRDGDYLSRLTRACAFSPGAEQFRTRASTDALCAGDWVDVVTRGSGAVTASCGLGRFEPVARR